MLLSADDIDLENNEGSEGEEEPIDAKMLEVSPVVELSLNSVVVLLHQER